MNDTASTTGPASGDPGLGAYELRIRTHLDLHWADWFEATQFDHNPDGTTTVRTGPIDHARLHGVLVRLFNMGGVLLRLERHVPHVNEPPSCRLPAGTQQVVRTTLP
jgi:hypothetical protein